MYFLYFWSIIFDLYSNFQIESGSISATGVRADVLFSLSGITRICGDEWKAMATKRGSYGPYYKLAARDRELVLMSSAT